MLLDSAWMEGIFKSWIVPYQLGLYRRRWSRNKLCESQGETKDLSCKASILLGTEQRFCRDTGALKLSSSTLDTGLMGDFGCKTSSSPCLLGVICRLKEPCTLRSLPLRTFREIFGGFMPVNMFFVPVPFACFHFEVRTLQFCPSFRTEPMEPVGDGDRPCRIACCNRTAYLPTLSAVCGL